jgi:pimeloyl-ACP methyl ester carboxylesterase
MSVARPVLHWWDTTVGTVAGWVSDPGRPTDSVVLLLPAFGYEHSSSYRTLRAAAEALAAQGHLAVRLDPPGTGDAGGRSDEVRLEASVQAVVETVDALRAGGAARVGLVGLRTGAAVALAAAERTRVDGLALWSIAAGRRHRRELSLMGVSVTDDQASTALPAGSVVIGGYVFPQALLDELAAVDLDAARVMPGTRTLVLDRDDRPPQDALAAALRAAGADVDQLSVGGHDSFLDRPSEDAEVGVDAVEALARWWSALSGRPGTATAPGRPTVRLPWDGASVVEEVVSLGERDLVGVVSRGDTPARDALVLLNSGSDPHTGPGRAWVEYARGLASRGVDVVRLDFRAWGDSPHLDSSTGRPYDAEHGGDAEDAITALRERGYDQVVLGGLCAGAWVGLDVARRVPVDGVLALNAQLYWQPGDPIEALMSDTRVRRHDEIEQIHTRALAGEWDRADEAGERPPAGRWLDELSGRGVPVSLVFAEGDDGIEYLRDRLGRRVTELQGGGLLHVREVPEIDHSMARVWLRPTMLGVLSDELGWLLRRR